MNPRTITALLALVTLPLLLALSGSSPGRQDPKPNRYIGVAKCKNCHQAKEAGDQFGHWEASKHHKAFETLATKEALAAGKDRGVTDPQTDAKCLKCHQTAYGVAANEIMRGFNPKLGVQCETCHGPGENHMKARMRAAAESSAGAPGYVQVADEEIVKAPEQKVCLACHNEESPSFKPFCFYKFVADIRHLNPQKPRTEADQKAMLVCGCGDKCTCKSGCDDGKCGVPPKDAAADKGADK